MSKENRSEIIHDALSMLDDDMIEEVDRLRGHVAGTVAERKNDIDCAEQSQYQEQFWRKPLHWRRWTALAASICLLVIGSWAWEHYLNTGDSADNENRVEGENNAIVEAESEYTKDEIDNPAGTESISLDINCGMTDNVEDEVGDGPSSVEEGDEPTNMGGTEQTENSVEAETEADYPSVLGDEFHLLNNYVKVSILPAKAWDMETADLSQAVTIQEDYRADMDKLVTNMCEASCVKTAELEESDMDMVYHIFFERKDGKIIHCWLLEDGYLCYDDLQEVCLKLDREVYAAIFKIFAMHW